MVTVECKTCQTEFETDADWKNTCKDCFKRSKGWRDCKGCDVLFNSRNGKYKLCWDCNKENLHTCADCEKYCNIKYPRCFSCSRK